MPPGPRPVSLTDIRPRIAAIQGEHPDYFGSPEALAAAVAVWAPDGRVNDCGVFEGVNEEAVARGRATASVGVCRVRDGVYVHGCRLESSRSGFASVPSVWRADPHPTADAARRAGIAELLAHLGGSDSADTSALRARLQEFLRPADLTSDANRATAGPRNPPPGGPMPRKKKTVPVDRNTSDPLPPAGEKVYRGRRGTGGAAVTVVDDGVERPLELRLDLRRHSPTGFGWGYAGSGPAQLALALAADALGDDDRARAVYQRLKAAVIAGLPSGGWELTAEQVRAAVREIEQGRRPAHPADDQQPPHENRTTPAGEAPGVAAPADSPPPAVTTDPPALPGRPETDDTRPPTHVAAHRPDGPRRPNPYGYRQDVAAGVRLLEDRRFKQVQLKFADKPSAAVRQAVRDAGYQWRDDEQVWTRQIDPANGWQTRADADDLFERVTAMIRAEHGITHEVT